MKTFFNDIPLLGLDKQIGLINFGVFGVFSGKLSTLFWYCRSLIHGKMDLIVFPTKIFGFLGLTYIVHPKSIPNMIIAIKNLRNSHYTSVVSHGDILKYAFKYSFRLCPVAGRVAFFGRQVLQPI